MLRSQLLPSAIALLALVVPALPQDDEPAPDPAPVQERSADEPVDPPPEGDRAAATEAAQPEPPPVVRYHAGEERDALLARWTANGLAEPLSLGETHEGRPLTGVVIAAPGPRPAAERTTVLVVAGLDGRSLGSTEVAVRVVEDLLAAADRLPDDVAVVVVPWANPDGLARTALGRPSPWNGAAVDDDQDGLDAEDGPDDVDGDGAVLSMLLADPGGPLARAEQLTCRATCRNWPSGLHPGVERLCP